jgi:hypothetical protein
MVIVVLTLIALLGMVVLTVDVGQLLFKRRAMVNASDAAALAAAQSCAGVDDADVPEALADAFAVENVSVATGGITDVVGCDGEAYGHVTVEYQMQQDLFFAGVLGFSGPAAVATEATAGWGPTAAGNPVPVVVYTGDSQSQGGCDIQEHMAPDQECYLWYDNDLFENSAFGFLNLCTATDPCQHGWDVAAGASCPSVGASLRSDWISGNWSGGPNEVNWPDATYVCRVGGLASSDWRQLERRVGDDLMFPVNECESQVDRNGNVVGCDEAPDKYNIVGFIVLNLRAVHDSAAEWGGVGYSFCTRNNVDVTPGQVIPLSSIPGGQCPNGSTPSGVENLLVDGQPPGARYTYDDLNKTVTWTGPAGRVDFEFNWWLDGRCGRPPSNSSAVCLEVTTVQPQFRGIGINDGGPDFGVRAVRLCDLEIGSCPQDD